jgi:hypothetical protein
VAQGVLDSGHGDPTENEPTVGGQVEQVDIDAGLGDLSEDGGGPAWVVFYSGHDDLTLVLDLKARVDQGPPSWLGILDEDVVRALATANESTGAFDVDSGSAEGIARLGESPGSIDKAHCQIR